MADMKIKNHKYPVGTFVYIEFLKPCGVGSLHIMGTMFVYRHDRDDKGNPTYWVTPYASDNGTGWPKASVTLKFPEGHPSGRTQTILNEEASTDLVLEVEGPFGEDSLKPHKKVDN